MYYFIYFRERTKVLAQFRSDSGEEAGPPIELPVTLERETLQQILNTLLKQVNNNLHIYISNI